ncbi:MAG: class I SAM-dependent methyltransferase [Pirellulales bacterium]
MRVHVGVLAHYMPSHISSPHRCTAGLEICVRNNELFEFKIFTWACSMSATATTTTASASFGSQTNQPRGLTGKIIGWWMGWVNRRLNELTLERLGLLHGQDVLEIGCGAGRALETLTDRYEPRHVAGIDPSQEMVDQARQSCRSRNHSCSFQVEHGNVESLPWPDASFDRVYAVSNFHIWNSCCEGLREIYRVLRPHGRLVICLRKAREKPWFFDQPGVSETELDDDVRLIRHIGFANVHVEEIPRRQSILFLAGMKESESK